MNLLFLAGLIHSVFSNENKIIKKMTFDVDSDTGQMSEYIMLIDTSLSQTSKRFSKNVKMTSLLIVDSINFPKMCIPKFNHKSNSIDLYR